MAAGTVRSRSRRTNKCNGSTPSVATCRTFGYASAGIPPSTRPKSSRRALTSALICLRSRVEHGFQTRSPEFATSLQIRFAISERSGQTLPPLIVSRTGCAAVAGQVVVGRQADHHDAAAGQEDLPTQIESTTWRRHGGGPGGNENGERRAAEKLPTAAPLSMAKQFQPAIRGNELIGGFFAAIRAG